MNADEYRWHYDYVRLACDSGFSFHALKSKSVQSLGQLDIEQLIREKDVATIERYINTVSEFNLDSEQIKILDPGFVKVFQISQLAVQYLLFCKKYLDNTVGLIKNDFQKNNEETKNLKRYVEELKLEASNSKKQIKDLKLSLNAQIANQNNPIFQCNDCPKAFSTEEYLFAHIKRRHDINKESELTKTSFQVETDKLQLEIKELKERLNNTEKFIQNDDIDAKFKYANASYQKSAIENTYLTDLQHKFELLKSHVENELRILQTQKFGQEKYEKWFETFLHQLGSTHAEEATKRRERSNSISAQSELPFCSKCQNCEFESGEQRKSKHSFATQTEADVIVREANNDVNKSLKKQTTTAVKAVQLQPVTYSYSETVEEKTSPEDDNRLEKFEEIIQEKVSGSIEKLENQMQSFMNKMNEIEQQTKNNKELIISEQQNPKTVNSETVVETLYLKPKSEVNKRTKARLLKQRTSVSSDDTSMKIKAPKQKIVKTTHITVPKNSIVRSNNPNKFQRNASLSESDTDSEISDDTSTNESSEDEHDEPKTNSNGRKNFSYISNKSSNVSTLGKRSLTSLKEVAFAPEILNGLQKEIENVLNDRLEELGVSPNWTSLPVRSYQRAMNIVNHQASLIQKNIPNYLQIRSHILKAVENQIATNNPIDEPAPVKYSKLKSLLSNVKRKTKSVRKTKEKENKAEVMHTVLNKNDVNVNKRPSKIETVHLTPMKRVSKESPIILKPLNKPESLLKMESSTKLGKAPSMQMYMTDSDPETFTKNETANNAKINDNKQAVTNKYPIIMKPISKLSSSPKIELSTKLGTAPTMQMLMTDSDTETYTKNETANTTKINDNKQGVTKKSPVILKPLTKLESPFKISSSTKLGTTSMQIYTTDSDTETYTKIETTNTTKIDDIKESALRKPYNDVIRELNTTFTLNPAINKDSISDISNPDNPSKAPGADIVNDQNVLEQQSKSAFKSSTTSLQKKKVLFNLDSSEASPQLAEKQAILTKTDGDTTSVASSILDVPRLSKVEEASKSNDEEQQLSDISDWDISDLN